MNYKILLIDNYDSFTYNLYQYLHELGAEVTVKRNDEITLAEAKEMEFSHLVISPGPGGPESAGVTGELLSYYYNKKPVLGVCLGHQALAHVFGGKVIRAPRVMHGKTSRIYHDNKTIYHGLANPFIATRYHSLIVSEEQLPECFEIASYTSEGEIMGIRMKDSMAEGVQFHPESILTVEGKKLLLNFLEGAC
jgi:anthranilate synthase/aminodeoxychorismate synthase-like glutamine amidotransferase